MILIKAANETATARKCNERPFPFAGRGWMKKSGLITAVSVLPTWKVADSLPSVDPCRSGMSYYKNDVILAGIPADLSVSSCISALISSTDSLQS